MDDRFCVVTESDGTFVMTKRQFYDVFPNVIATVSYKQNREYSYSTLPQKAMPLRI